MLYNPNPPRVWSRVQNQCTYIPPGSNYNQIYIPLSGQTVSQGQANYEEKLYYKGNILQYKANSATLTKKQRYSQIAKGGGPNRKKCFATQSQTYSNPNTTGLLWTNYITLPFPNQLVGQPNNISGPFQYNVASPFGCSSTSVQEGGNLVCGTYANQCTGEIIKSGPTSGTICNPSSCSDVPGKPVELCWNDKLQTYYPRQNYSMNNSANKWPEGYKGFVSAVTPTAPFLTLDSYTDSSVNLSWTNLNSNCLPISSYNIYQNGKLIEIVPYTVTSIAINGLYCSDNSFYVTSLSGIIESAASNTVNVIGPHIPAPLLTLDSSGNTTATISWTNLYSYCISRYNIYQNNVLIYTVPNTTTTITINSLSCVNNFYVTNLSNSIESPPSNIVTSYNIPFLTTGNPIIQYANNYYTITFTSNGTINFCANNASIIAVGGGGGGGAGYGFYGDGLLSGGGGGGAGGGIGLLTDISFNIGQTFTITIGNGGIGGTTSVGSAGANTTFKDSANNNYLTATGGSGGAIYLSDPPCQGGIGGTSTSLYDISIYNNANGGNGDQQISYPSPGTIGYNINPLMPITLPDSQSFYFSGGGAGGIYNIVSYGGNAGLNGNGGTFGNTSVNGQNASSYGSGGGGGGGGYPVAVSDFFSTVGGNGANGVVIINFQYP